MSPDANDSSKSGNLKDSARFGEIDHGRSELVEVMTLFDGRAKRAGFFLLLSVASFIFALF